MMQAAADCTREAGRVANFLTTLSLTGTTLAIQDAANIVA
jgi:hypothetical protein